MNIDFDKSADEILNSKDVDPDRSFVQATRDVNVINLARDTAAWHQRRKVRTIYRVFLTLKNGNFGEAENEVLQFAFREAKKRAENPLPKVAA